METKTPSLRQICSKFGLNYMCMIDIANGRQKTHAGGWKCKKIKS